MIRLHNELQLPTAGLSGFEPPLTDEESAIQLAAHRFAQDVLRPAGRELDRMSAEEVIAPGSPYWSVLAETAKLGISPAFFAQFEPAAALRLEALVAEEMGWGDAGLAVSLAVATLPLVIALSKGNKELAELCANRIGCWVGTQPDRGSDAGLYYPEEWPAGVPQNKGNILAKVSADEIVLNGQSSAWISNGAVAQVAVCFVCADYGAGFHADDGSTYNVAVIVPLDSTGVSRGKPLEKIGQRALPQGEIYFDNVRVPRRFAVALAEDYHGMHASTWSYAGSHMCTTFTGVARSAFEHALAYAHERKQGGAALIEHQLTCYRLGDMARRVEMMRAIARRSMEFSRLSPRAHPYVTAQAKVSVTEEAMKVVHEAFQLFGGNGTTRAYPIEKLFRDTRSALIEDGENYVLTMRLGVLLSRLYQEGWAHG